MLRTQARDVGIEAFVEQLGRLVHAHRVHIQVAVLSNITMLLVELDMRGGRNVVLSFEPAITARPDARSRPTHDAARATIDVDPV